jgi:hypothetical protein
MTKKEATAVSREEADTRAFVRFPATIPILVIARWNGTTKIVPGRCADLSENGIRLAVPMPLVPGQSISVEFKAPVSNQFLKLEAVVRHRCDQHCGCEFLDASPEQRLHFRKLADSN